MYDGDVILWVIVVVEMYVGGDFKIGLYLGEVVVVDVVDFDV